MRSIIVRFLKKDLRQLLGHQVAFTMILKVSIKKGSKLSHLIIRLKIVNNQLEKDISTISRRKSKKMIKKIDMKGT